MAPIESPTGPMGRREPIAVITLGERVEELRNLAKRRGVADQVGDLPDARLAIQAYAVALGFDVPLSFDLQLTLKEIEAFSV